jgi:hypothetical protein
MKFQLQILLLTFLLGFLYLPETTTAQDFVLQPATQADSEGEYEVKLLYKSNRTLRFTYNTNLSNRNAFIKIGRVSNTYDVQQYSVSGTQRELIPNQAGLKPGKYFARITNSEFEQFSRIKEDNKDGVIYSNEIQFIVEAPKAPKVIAPRGQIENATPTFEWEGVEGVKGYWIIVSSTPFDITTNDDNEISIEGANLVWQFITSETTAQYGDINTNTPYQDEAPPLNPNKEYSYTILNLFEEDDPVFASPVFGGIVPFTFVDENPIPAPDLIEPANNEAFVGEETITFRWTEVEQAKNYSVNLYEVITQQGVDASVPIWSVTTTNNIVDYPALGALKNSTYKWNVVANDPEGGGTTSGTAASPTSDFDYEIPLGTFRIGAKSAIDNSSLIGLEVDVRAISGGVTPNLPVFIQSSSVSDDLVEGTYEFTAKKEGYKDNVKTATIREGNTTRIDFVMEGLPASVSGKVTDQSGNAIKEAIVELTDIRSGAIFSTKSITNGNFNVSAPEGTYSITISRDGYKTSEAGNITLSLNQQVTVEEPYELIKYEEIITGSVLNELSNGIRLAKVTASNTDGEEIELRTNGDGFYRISVSPGTWTLSASKSGFVLNNPKTIEISRGQRLDNQNINMVSAANQVSGFVKEVIVAEDGSVGNAPLSGVEVRAVPSSGAVVTTTTSNNGSFSLDLKSGSYTLSPNLQGFESNDSKELTLGNGETVNGINMNMTEKTSTVSGRVVATDGSGLSNVTISVSGDQNQSVQTRSGGYYNLSLSSGEHTIKAKLAGYTSDGDKQVNLNAGQSISGINFRLTPNAAVIRGTVKSNGEALAFSSVFVEGSNGNVSEEETDEFGAYTLSVRPGTWNISAGKYGYLRSSSETVSLDAGQESQGVDFNLVSNTRVIRGRVTNGGNPVRNTVAILRDEEGNRLKDSQTKVDGTFSFLAEVDNGYRLEIRKEGFNTYRETIDNLPPSEENYSLSISIQTSPAQIKGKVTTASGAPLRDARVVLLNNGEAVADLTTDFEGNYSIGVDAGEYQMQVDQEGYSQKTQNINLGFGEVRESIDFSLNENYALYRGTVKDENGNLVGNAFLNLTSGERGYSAQVDENGNYRMTKIVAGTYQLSVEAEGYESLTKEGVEVTAAANITDDIQLNAKQGSISGTVQNSSTQNPIIDATVTATASNGQIYTTVSDQQGNYTLDNMGLGEYTIEVAKSGFRFDEDVSVTLTEESSIEESLTLSLLRKLGVISGQVTDGETKLGLKNVEVIATGPGTDRAVTNNEGQFSISGLAVGIYEVQTTKDQYTVAAEEITITNEAPSVNRNFEIFENTGILRGKIENQQGASLNQVISLTAKSENETFETLSDKNGNFTFSEITKGQTYILETSTSGEGLINTQREVKFGESIDELTLPDPLVIQQNTSVISGSAGIGDATVELADGSGEVIRTKLTEPEGDYRFGNLAEGNYTVSFNLSGYVFSENQISVQNLAFNQEREVSVNATPNFARVNVQVNNSQGTGEAEASITIISQDQQLRYEATTNTEGVASISQVDASKSYGVFVKKEGFTLTSELPSALTLQAGVARNITVQLSRNDFNLFGTVSRSDNSAKLNEADVFLKATDGTFQQNTTTNNNGEYYFTSIPEKEYQVEVSRAGFGTDSLDFNITTLTREQKSYQGISYNFSIAEELVLQPAFINIRGRVISNLGGVKGASVQVISSTEVQATTNNNGVYRINGYPVSFSDQDTIAIVIELNYNEFTTSQTIEITRNNLGSLVNPRNFIIPSGRIRGFVESGGNPVTGVEITLDRPGNASPLSFVTNNEGAFVTDSTLRAGVYAITVNTEEFLIPRNAIQIELEEDTSRIVEQLELPFRFDPPDSLQAAFETQFTITASGVNANSVDEANLFYKNVTESTFDTLALSFSSAELTGVLPPQNNVQPLQFYTEVTVQDDSSLVYRSPTYQREVGARGLLESIVLDPVINNLALRINDEYDLDVLIKDGSNNIMNQVFEEESGEIEVLESSEGITVEIDEETQQVTLTTGEEEINGSFRISATLGDQRVINSFLVEVQDVEISDIAIQQISGGSIANDAPYSFGISAQDTSGNRVILGNKVSWEVTPSFIGEITNSGLFTPSPNTIGEFSVVVSDESSGNADSSEVVALFATVNPDTATTLNYGPEMELSFSEGVLDGQGTVKLKKTAPETPKQFVTPLNSEKSFKSSERLFNITLDGAELTGSASLLLSAGSEFRLNSGKMHIAHFDEEQLQWELLDSQVTQDSLVSTDGVTGFSQFAILIENQPLGLEHFAVLPNPFSPRVAPAKLGYLLHSQNPPAYVTIRIYNMRGELIRTLLDRDAQMPGIYGSSAGEKLVEWDGLTDNGEEARNGRYAVHIIIEDGTGKEKYLKSLVLIK